MDLEALGLTDIASMAFSVDGSILYVVGSGPEVDGESVQRIVGVSASDGTEVSAADVTGTVDDIRSLLTPQVIR